MTQTGIFLTWVSKCRKEELYFHWQHTARKRKQYQSASHCALSKHSLDVWDLLVNYKTFQQALFMKQILIIPPAPLHTHTHSPNSGQYTKPETMVLIRAMLSSEKWGSHLGYLTLWSADFWKRIFFINPVFYVLYQFVPSHKYNTHFTVLIMLRHE